MKNNIKKQSEDAKRLTNIAEKIRKALKDEPDDVKVYLIHDSINISISDEHEK